MTEAPDTPSEPDPPAREVLRAHSWVVPQPHRGTGDPREAYATGPPGAAGSLGTPGSTDPSEPSPAEVELVEEPVVQDPAVHAEFNRRVDERIRVARYPHSLKRVTLSPHELAEIREIDQQAAVWVPVTTFAVTAVSAVLVVLLAAKIAQDPTHGRVSDAVVVLLTLGFLGAGFGTLVRSQAYFDGRRPTGRNVRSDLADAYETVRDGAPVFIELGVAPGALSRIADLLPQAERLLDFLVLHESRGGTVKGHPAYEQVIRMGAEVTVLTDMAEEHLGRRSSRRRDRLPDSDRAEACLDPVSLTPFDTLADLVAMMGIEIPSPRETRDVSTDHSV